MPHWLESDAGRRRGHLAVNGVQRSKTLAVNRRPRDWKTDPERVRARLGNHFIDPTNARNVGTTPLWRTERLRHPIDGKCLLVVRAKHDDNEIGMVVVKERLQMGRPVVKPRRRKPRRLFITLDQL